MRSTFATVVAILLVMAMACFAFASPPEKPASATITEAATSSAAGDIFMCSPTMLQCERIAATSTVITRAELLKNGASASYVKAVSREFGVPAAESSLTSHPYLRSIRWSAGHDARKRNHVRIMRPTRSMRRSRT